MENHAYGMSRTTGLAVEEAIAAVTATLQSEGFGILSDIDVQATLQRKLGVERPPYRILGACNPSLAQQALAAEPELGLLLPCNVLVRATEEGQTVISVVDARAMLGVVGHDRLAPLAQEVTERLNRALAAVP